MPGNQSIQKAFTILRTIAAHPEGIGVTGIAHALDMHKSTVSRMVATLYEEGVVDRNGNLFTVGDGLALLAAGSVWPDNLIRIARPILQQLSDATGETINLALNDQSNKRYVHYIFQIDSIYNLQISDWTGRLYPLHSSVDGKVLLAWRGEAEIHRYLSGSRGLEQFTQSTITDPKKLWVHLAQIRKNGYAVTDGEYEDGIYAVSVPIFAPDGSVIASFCVGGPKFRFPQGEQKQELIRLMKVKSAEIGQRVRPILEDQKRKASGEPGA